MRLRRLAILAAVLATLEGLGFAADCLWPFRVQLIQSFQLAERRDAVEEALWPHPEKVFDADNNSYTQALRFRIKGSPGKTGEAIDPASLPPGSRVAVLGESAAFGVNVSSTETFAALLDDALKPQETVLNAGQTGADPWQVMEAGAQLLKNYSPKTLIVFTGNNQWIQWWPPQQRTWNPRVVGLLSSLAESRFIAGLEMLMIRGMFRVRPPVSDFSDHFELTGSGYALKHPLPPSVQFAPADWASVKKTYLARFESSLNELVKHAKASGVRVILVTMPFNYRLSPAWKHPQFEAYIAGTAKEVTEAIHEAGREVQAGDCVSAIPIIEKALALDSGPPLLHYLRAQCLEKLNRLDEAESEYAQSRERMIGNLGSRLSVNEIIRQVGEKQQVTVVDAAKLFDDYEHAHGKHFNEDTIVDDCHPSPLGHKLIADALLPLLNEPR